MVTPKLYNHDLDGSWDGSPRDSLARHGVTQHSEFDKSLGTVGAGNHFSEICKIEKIVDSEARESIGLREGEITCWLPWSRVIHLPVVHQSDANPCITSASAEFQAYLDHHDHAVKCAQANRDLVAHRIKYCLFEKVVQVLSAHYEGAHSKKARYVQHGESSSGVQGTRKRICARSRGTLKMWWGFNSDHARERE